MNDTALPRVTYANVRADFSALHALLDERIPAFCAERLGADHPNWIDGGEDRSGESYEAASPIDRDLLLGRFHRADAHAVHRAVEAARAAFRDWSRLPWRARVAGLKRVADELEASKIELGIAALLEVGKSRFEAMGEAEEAIDLVRYYCAQMEAHKGYKQDMARAFPVEETRERLRPVGVFGVIAPFNYPIALSVNMITGAILTGNAVVFKPSPMAGLTATLLHEAFRRAGLPEGVVNLVCGDAATGEALVAHPDVDGFAFTGSHRIGMGILRKVAAGHHNRPVVVEMGGKNPAYVTATADLEVAAEGVMRSAFGLQGQKCSAESKVYVDERVREPFLERLVAMTRRLKTGDPRARDVFVGPLINAAALERFERSVAEARQDGVVLCGGGQLSGGAFDRGAYVEPTIVADLPAGHRVNREELFLPLLSVLSFTALEEAIEDGNRVDYGLTAGIYTGEERDLDLFLDRAEAGVLYANRASGATTGAWPGIQTFCGWKGSGVTNKGGLGPWYLPQFMREQSVTLWRG